MEVEQMATMWTLIEMCIADARLAEDLTRDLTARRELRLDPDAALAGFSLGLGTRARGMRKVGSDGERRGLVAQARQDEEQDAA
jgi:hypothetical protein